MASETGKLRSFNRDSSEAGITVFAMVAMDSGFHRNDDYPLCASQGGKNWGRLLGRVFVASDLELYRSRWVLRGNQGFNDADSVNGFGNWFYPGT